MTLPVDKLELCRYVNEVLESRDLVRRSVSGKVPARIDFDEIIQVLDEKGLLAESDKNERTITFSLPAGYYQSFSDFIIIPGHTTDIPSRFYIEDISYFHSDDFEHRPEVIKNYMQICKFFSLLEKIADYKYELGTSKELVFINKEKLEVSSLYSSADLVDFNFLDDFEREFVRTDIHVEQKKTIVKTVLIDMFYNEGKIPFSVIIKNIEDIYNKIKESYQLYVSEFSFQKIKEEVEKEKLDATLKLNKVFSDIQNQLLAVPAALILAGGQFQNTHDWSSKNVLIWLGVVVFSIFMSMLIRNQRHTLDAVDLEIKLQWDNIKGKHFSIAPRFESAYSGLKARFRHQKRLLDVVSFLVSAALFITTVLLLHYSQPLIVVCKSLLIGFVCATLVKIGYVLFSRFKPRVNP